MSSFREALSRLRDARAALNAAEAHHEAAKVAVQELLTEGQVDAAEAPGIGSVTWRTAKDTQTTDWRAVATAAGATPEQIEQHTTVRPGARTFRFTPA